MASIILSLNQPIRQSRGITLLKRILAVILLGILTIPALAQSSPSIDIVVSANEASSGSTIYADVMIRGGVAIAGADVGITVDGACLKVVGREAGNYLPTDSAGGGFTPFDETTETGTRLAANVIDRGRIANGDGVFYRAVLETTCDAGTSTIEVTYAQLAALADPGSGSNTLIAYSLQRGNLPVNTAQVTVAPGVQANVTVATLAPMPAEASAATQGAGADQSTLIVVIAVVAASGLGFFFMMLLYLRSRRRQNR